MLPVSFEEWEYRARERLTNGPFDYVAGGAGGEETMRANREAFHRWRIQPHVLTDVAERDVTVSLLGHTFPTPVLLAPISAQAIFHPDAELASAKAAASLNIPFITSTAASRSMEEIAAVMGNSPRWFQLYWSKDTDVTTSMVRRAEAAGYTAIVVTVDFPVYGWREREVRNAYFPAQLQQSIANYVSDPAFRAKLPKTPEQDIQQAIGYFLRIFFNETLSWKDIDFLRTQTKLPIFLKGILRPQDAQQAVAHGVDGIIVSNHGGRQVDGAIAALDALPGICEVVQRKIPVLMDSGIRRGTDVIKALALGASAVLVGRPYIYGLAVAGEEGVAGVLRNLLADIDRTLAASGRKSISEIDSSLLVQERR
jgi:lactate 2-monooxygenase